MQWIFHSIGESAKKFAALAAIFIGLIAVFMLLLSTPTAYIHDETDFLCVFMPRKLYECDAIGYGRNYDSLHIFLLNPVDASRLNRFAANSDQWQPLPIPDDVMNQTVCNPEYDSRMRQMLNATSGWWCGDHALSDIGYCDLYVFDAGTNILYIRTASVFVTDTPK